MFEQRLERSPAESPLGGVCTGIANYFNIDPIFLNLAVVGLTLLGLIFLPVLYLILWLVLPVEGEVAIRANSEREKTKKAANIAVHGLRYCAKTLINVFLKSPAPGVRFAATDRSI